MGTSCPGYEFVLGTSCPGYELSWVRVVLGTSCPGYELPWVRVVLGTSCPGYELSWVRVVQIPVLNTIESRGVGFGPRDWPPQIFEFDGFVVDVGVLRRYVNSNLLILLTGGLKPCTVVNRGEFICQCHCMVVRNIPKFGDDASFFPLR